MSAACKTILKTLHARGAKPPPWAGEWPPALTRMFYARRNWPTLLRRHPARRETAAQAADLPEAGFSDPRPPAPPADTRAAPRGEAVHCPCEHCNKAACVGAAAHRHRPAYKQPPSDKPNHHRLSVRGHATKPYSSPIAQPGGISGFAGLLTAQSDLQRTP